MPPSRHFKQVDVFTRVPLLGNPLAVVLDAEGLDDAQMQAIARWTHLSETTFVLPPTDPAADYRVRIFTPSREFPFAGHPTLGTAHALLESGLQPRNPGRLVQQCGVGLVAVDRPGDGSLAFLAPPGHQSGLSAGGRALLDAALPGAGEAAVVDMGIRWLAVALESATACLGARVDVNALDALCAGAGVDGLALYGRHAGGGPADYEVRALYVEDGQGVEDPVTGSANACIARVLLARDGPLAGGYRVRQGTCLQRDGRLSVEYVDGQPWIGGHSVTVIDGTIRV
ncbi:PhzF family phenazine biosynthesis protein [Paludibacterium yongneupense]|uniref:PhzF family phenazine biosynthesis protein n=1 Tax=Paludibacterium yongneupense TaxID=400061 RepID=UPI0004254943|nr:PhzF family phenazine biosynthesis protein [Paludibacterium yongneupense]